jgi:glycosyltransferase involved in cell wall biosynthesis
MKVSVVIPAYNSGKTIRECLISLLANDYDDFEIVIVDDCSKDDTEDEVISVKNEKIKLLKNPQNSGASFSRNYGVKKAGGEIIIFLDSDTITSSDWISRFVKLYEEVPSDIYGGGIIGLGDTIYSKADKFCSWWTSIPYSKSGYLKTLHLPTNNLSFKKKTFEKIGGLNESLRLGGEDAEFCFRALKMGLKIYFDSDLTIEHHDRNTYKGFIAHNKNWGRHARKMRTELKMNYSLLMPGNYIMAHFYIFPLAVLYTGFIIGKWLRYNPSVIIYTPIIFLGKFHQALEIKNSFKK